MVQTRKRPLFRITTGLLVLLSAVLLGGCGGIALPWAQTPTPEMIATSTAIPAAPTVAALPTQTGTPVGFVPDVEIAMKATQGQTPILPGSETAVWKYEGTLLRGDSSSLQPLQNSYLGPIIRVRKGQKVRVHFTNDLPEPSIIHWHGLIVPARMDGHPRDAVQPGQTYVYEFEVKNRPGTYWYHPHPEPLTGGQVVRGLAGLFIVADDEEQAASLPSDGQDIPIVIQDRTFDQNNQIVYLQDGMGGMGGMIDMERMMGFLGERILVNGQVTPLMPVSTRAYRLRVLNGSNSRVYKLGWSHGAPVTVIGTDGGLLERPADRPYVMLGPGERVDVWADFRQFPLGTEVTLQSLPFLGAEGDSLLTPEGSTMPGMDMGQGSMPSSEPAPTAQTAEPEGDMEDYNPNPPNGAGFPILYVRVDRQEQETLSLPEKLSTMERYPTDQIVNAGAPRRFGLSMLQGTWVINGRSFKMEEVVADEVVKQNTVEAWEFINEQNPNEMMDKMGMVHPLHIHGVQFQVVEREVMNPALRAGWDSVYEGYVDEGWKDTVLVMPGERVKVLVKFEFPDLFLFHCHNLEHEDIGMMRNYRAEP